MNFSNKGRRQFRICEIKMISLLPVLVLVYLTTTSTFADSDLPENNDDDSTRPLIYDIPVLKILKQVVDFGCGVRDFLSDREVSDRIEKVLHGGLKESVSNGIGCVESRLFDVMNNRSTDIGKGISIIFLGNPVNITSFLDVLRPMLSPLFLFNLSNMMNQMNIFKMLDEVKGVFQQITEKCGDEAIGTFKGELDFLYKKAIAIYDKYTNTRAA